MTGVVKMPRTYDATRRQEQAQENRARVLGAARARFLADGYTATTIPGVARDAGVSVQTVYKAFGNKAGLLKAVFDVAVTGDDQLIPVAERDPIKRIQAEPDPRSKLRMYSQYFVQGAHRDGTLGTLDGPVRPPSPRRRSRARRRHGRGSTRRPVDLHLPRAMGASRHPARMDAPTLRRLACQHARRRPPHPTAASR
jgi:AcrR family transcriptional regulator